MDKTDYPKTRDMTRAEIRAYYRKRDKTERSIAAQLAHNAKMNAAIAPFGKPMTPADTVLRSNDGTTQFKTD